MKKMIVIPLIIVIASIILVSCGKQSDNAKNKTDIQNSSAPQNAMNATTEENSSTTSEPATTETNTTSQSNSDTTQTETASAGSTAQPAAGNPSQDANASPATSESKPQPESNSTQNDMLALAKKSGCLACHNVDKKVVGPAWRDVSKRYKGVAQARARLIEKISKGGRGNWTKVVGNAAMPPYFPRVSKENIEKLVDFVLSL